MNKTDYRIVSHDSQMTPGLLVYRKEEIFRSGKSHTVRVAAYCRVSTDMEIQQSSLTTQMESYERIIKEHPGWKLVGIYADRGITGTSDAKRAEFKRMIADAMSGKIDYILAKSTSRFARNTVDTLSYTRALREKGVGVYFEEQNIDTKSQTSEILLTIHAAFAQEESHSISENMKKGIRSRYAMGTPKWTCTYGMQKIGDDRWVPDPRTAPIVKRIFNLCLDGQSMTEIAKTLEKENIPGPGEQKKWYPHSVSVILHNEKYVGDVAMQKAYTVDHLSHRKVSNKDATVARYYMKDHHPAIVDRDTFEAVQQLLEMRDPHKGSVQYPFYSFLRCPFCGEKMVAVSLPSRDHESAWTCGGKANGEAERFKRTDCPEYFIKSKYIHEAVISAANGLYTGLAGGQIGYKFLHTHVARITFPLEHGTVDWDHPVVTWKDGQESIGEISYGKPSDIPVTRNTMHFTDGIYYANGKATGGMYSAYQSVEKLFAFCRSILIFDQDKNSTAYYSRVPNVLAPNTRKMKGDQA